MDDLDNLLVSEYRVLRSAAGYYVGRQYLDPDCEGCWLPYDRCSGYFPSEIEAHYGRLPELIFFDCETDKEEAAVAAYYRFLHVATPSPDVAIQMALSH